MGTKPALEKKRVKEDIVYDDDRISEDTRDPNEQSRAQVPPNPYAVIEDVVSDAWSPNYKEQQGVTESTAKFSIRRTVK